MSKVYTEYQLRKFAKQKEKREAKRAAKALEPKPSSITIRTSSWEGTPTAEHLPPWELTQVERDALEA